MLLSCAKKNFTKELTTFTYKESQELSIETTDSVFISGSLEYVNSAKLVIFIAGSGPTDRDCNNVGGLKTDAFKMLAYYLKGEGISSFRFDKRGIGKSTKVQESDISFNVFVEDVAAIVSHFAPHFEDIILMGHSEGALIGSIVSSDDNIHSFISVSGVSESLDVILLDQLAQYPMLVPLAEKHINEIKNGQELSEVNPMLMTLFRPSLVSYLGSLFEIDPKAEVAKLNKPVLIVSGSCDLQVPDTHAKALHASIANSDLVIIENMGHAMKKLQDDCANAVEAYSDVTMELNPKFTTAIADFIKN